MSDERIEHELKLLKFFDNPTRSQISWNLVIHKELSATQLAEMIGKNISTITRNLAILEKNNLVLVSRVEMKRNFQEKYWRLAPNIVQLKLLLNKKTMESLSSKERKKLLKQADNFMVFLQGLMKSILEYEIRAGKYDSKLFMYLLNKEGAELLNKELINCVRKFREDNPSKFILDFENIDEESFIFFFLSSQIKNITGKR